MPVSTYWRIAVGHHQAKGTSLATDDRYVWGCVHQAHKYDVVPRTFPRRIEPLPTKPRSISPRRLCAQTVHTLDIGQTSRTVPFSECDGILSAPTDKQGQRRSSVPAHLGPWVGAQVASLRCPILRPGQLQFTVRRNRMPAFLGKNLGHISLGLRPKPQDLSLWCQDGPGGPGYVSASAASTILKQLPCGSPGPRKGSQMGV